MGLTDKLSDVIVKKITKDETVRLNYTQLASLVKNEFIIGANYEFLKKVIKTAKGGGFFTIKQLESKNGRYVFRVSNIITKAFSFRICKYVWVYDKEERKYYQTEKDSQWKKFYKLVDSLAKEEMINSSRN